MAESMPNWIEFRKIVEREVKNYFGSAAILVDLEVWDPEGQYRYERNKPKRRTAASKVAVIEN